ncbi:hypothetical protein IAR50_005353 [Cryptococcus sp. DSM 104548]
MRVVAASLFITALIASQTLAGSESHSDNGEAKSSGHSNGKEGEETGSPGLDKVGERGEDGKQAAEKERDADGHVSNPTMSFMMIMLLTSEI